MHSMSHAFLKLLSGPRLQLGHTEFIDTLRSHFDGKCGSQATGADECCNYSKELSSNSHPCHDMCFGLDQGIRLTRAALLDLYRRFVLPLLRRARTLLLCWKRTLHCAH